MNTPASRHALPRALVPLPGESLPGLLLRLAYRLERKPHQIAAHCGLHNDARIPAGHLLKLSSSLVSQVSHTLRLSTTETESLTLASLADTYAPLASISINGRHTVVTSGSQWAYSPSSRFCRQCLRGDGSRVQQAFGGAWKLRWHLPPVFACQEHRCLLETNCPACGQQVNGFVQQRGSLIQSPGVPGLHPLQCRSLLPPVIQPRPGRKAHIRACGARLDEASGPGGNLPTEEIERLVALQQRLEKRLMGGGPESAGQEAKPRTYLQDLIMATLLVKLSWPLGSTLLPSDSLRTSLDKHAGAVSALTSAERSSKSNAAHHLAGLRNLPHDAAQCGALLLAAETLLGDLDSASLHTRVQPLSQKAHERAAAFTRNALNSIDISPELARAAARRAPAFPAAPAPRGMPPSGAFELRHVPPFLPEPWFDAHFTGMLESLPRVTRGTVRHLRRGASLRLAEIASGLPWYKCSVALGIPQYSRRPAINSLGRNLGAHSLWPMFETAVAEVANELGRNDSPTDYVRRRRALAEWMLPLEDWTKLTDLPQLQHLRAKEYPDPASVFVWSEVTASEYFHNPMIQALRGSREPGSSLSDETGRFYGAHRPSGGWRRLRRRLDMYAAEIAQACDLGRDLRVDVDTLANRENCIHHATAGHSASDGKPEHIRSNA